MGAAEIGKRLGVSRQRVSQLAQDPAFPQPIADLAAGRIWRATDIERWITEHGPSASNADDD
jgi:predicted DNA-binding transcriptional regulator AlpA